MFDGQSKKKENSVTEALACPIPKNDYEQILLAHGGGGTLSHNLIQSVFLQMFRNPILSEGHDGALFEIGQERVAMTTDSYVVHPIFFPGGNIGDLAINGTINDLAMCGAIPKFLSAGFILEEGLPFDNLKKITDSMMRAAARTGVHIVTGDTKVVDRGKGDKIFINTSGIGIIPAHADIRPLRCKPGDVIIISGRIAEHGIAIMSAREGLAFDTTVISDTAPLSDLVQNMLAISKNIHVLRDPTRGGIASALNEIAATTVVGMHIDESAIPIGEQVSAACEILGLDPLYIANEGKLIAWVDRHDADRVLEAMQKHPLGKHAAIIGEVVDDHHGQVVMTTSIGSSRIVDMLSGEQLPRIC